MRIGTKLEIRHTFMSTKLNLLEARKGKEIPEEPDLDLPDLHLFNVFFAIIYHIAAWGNLESGNTSVIQGRILKLCSIIIEYIWNTCNFRQSLIFRKLEHNMQRYHYWIWSDDYIYDGKLQPDLSYARLQVIRLMVKPIKSNTSVAVKAPH
jgi:hypothetical protein